MEGLMEGYANLMRQPQQDDQIGDCRIQPDRTVARIVTNLDGSQRLVPSSTADPTSSEFQRLLGPQGSLTTALGIEGVSPTVGATTTTCPTGPTGCSSDPYFHFPDLERDSGDCLYVPTFNDVPMTISMATYFAQAFLKEVSPDKIVDEINQDIKNVFDKVVNANVAFNYVPIAVLLLVIVWILVLHSVIDWQTGVFLTAIIVAVLWLGYLLLDTTIRSDISTVASKTRDSVVNTLSVKNEDIICNILKGYYTAVSHMFVPQASICPQIAQGPTGPGPCACLPIPGSPTGFENILIPNPANIVNSQIKIGGEKRCDGINNSNTLLPVIDKICPCIQDVDGFTLANLTEAQKKEFFKCILDAVGGGQIIEEAQKCGTSESTLNPGLCALICDVARCNPVEGSVLAPGCFNN